MYHKLVSFAVVLACAAVLFVTGLADAHLNERVLVLKPDPLLATHEAESLPVLGTTKVVDDTTARSRSAIVVEGEGSGFEIDLGELPVGIYSVWVAAKVTDDDAMVNSVDLNRLAASRQQTKPLYLAMEVNSDNDGSVIRSRLRVPFSADKQYEYIAKLYFHAPQRRHYRAKITIAERSVINSMIVDYIDLRNPLGDLTFDAVKTGRVLVDDRMIDTMRVNAAKEGKLPRPLRPRPLSDTERAALDDIMWHQSTMPLNANPGQIYGPLGRGSEELTALRQQLEEQAGRKIGSWSLGGRNPGYDDPWTIINTELDLTYTRDDYDHHRTLPSPWPIPEDTGAFFYDKDRWNLSASLNEGIIPRAVQHRYHVVLGALGATEQSPIRKDQFDLPQRYLLLGDLEAAADGAFLLAAYAYHYPSYDWNLTCMVNIMDVGRTFSPSSVNGRGCSYQGWSTDEVIGVIRAYDYLFPYIQGNQALADRVGRFVPWVKTPQDVIKLLDTFLVQRAARDGVVQTLYAPIVPAAAIVLGPGPVADRYLDKYIYSGTVYMRNGLNAFADNIVNGYSRDGMNYIGSTYYVVGESVGEMLSGATLLGRYVAAGGDKRFNLSNPREYPRQAALADGLLGIHAAGGHRIGAGDVHDPQATYMPWQHVMQGETLDLYPLAWQWTKDPRYAWIVANKRGQGDLDDRTWQAVQKDASTARDPLLHTASRVLEGFGLARMEENIDATDPRVKFSSTLRFGVASGHAHPDTLDLEVYAYGIRATSDLGGRLSGQYGRPTCMSSFVHNVVQINDDNFNDGPQNSTALGWLTAFKPMPLAQYVGGAARAHAQPQVKDYRRGVLQVMSAAGDDLHPAEGYLFDVFRVAGGDTHTWCFHGCVSESFDTNASLSPATSETATSYLRRHHDGTKLEGKTPSVLTATWKLRRTEETINDVKLKNAEQTILRKLYDESAPEKFTKVSLFGHGGERAMVGNWYSTSKRQHSFPFLYVRREGVNGGTGVYPSLIEPYAENPIITNARILDVKGDATALHVQTRFGQNDFLFSAPKRGTVYPVENGVSASGDVALISRDANGLRLLHMVGGVELADAGIKVTVDTPQYTASIRSLNPHNSRLGIDQALPAKLLDGQTFTIGNDLRAETWNAKTVAGKQIDLDKTTRSYRGGIAYIADDGAYIQLDTPPSLASYHPTFFDGMTVVNEKGQIVGRAKVQLGDRFWDTSWPAARSHLAHIDKADLTDENGDGRVTVEMLVNPLSGTNGASKFAADGETVINLKPGEKMLDLEVTRVSDDGFMLFTKQHPREFLDSLKITHPGWPYHRQVIRNERGDKQWVVNMPGDTYQLTIDGRKFSAADFPDADGDGRAIIELHAVGPGDTLTAPTHVYLRRCDELGTQTYELRADAACTVTMVDTKLAVSHDGGVTWSDATGDSVSVDTNAMAADTVLIRAAR